MKNWLIKLFGGFTPEEYGKKLMEIDWLNTEIKAWEDQFDQLKTKYYALEGLKQDCEHKLAEYVKDSGQMIVDLNKQIAKYEQEDIHSSLPRFRQYIDTILPSPRYYDFGKGRRQVHTIFRDALSEDEKKAVIDFLVDFGYGDTDPALSVSQEMFIFNNWFSKKFPTAKYYAYDKELYGQLEYWALPSETIAKLRKGVKAFDCDDVMVLKWACLNWLLPNTELWRLRGFIVDLWSGGGHALLGWVDGKKRDWVPIETTFRDGDQHKINDYTIRNQLFYQIRYSFDSEHEYERI